MSAMWNHLNWIFNWIFMPISLTIPLLIPNSSFKWSSLIDCRDLAFAFQDGKSLIKLCLKRTAERTEWVMKAHFPVRTSPRGATLLLLSALDRRQSHNGRPIFREFQRVFSDSPHKIRVIRVKTDEELALFRHILRFNSTKIQPTAAAGCTFLQEVTISTWTLLSDLSTTTAPMVTQIVFIAEKQIRI